jgi:hypothetical protein
MVKHHEGSQPNKLAPNESIYLAGAGNYPMSVTNMFSGGVSSTHEEADTRMLLHAIHADKVFAEFGVKGRIIIKSPDTDVVASQGGSLSRHALFTLLTLFLICSSFRP